MSKSVHTAQCYAKSWKSQTSLDNFNFRSTNLPASLKPAVHAPFKNAPCTARKHPAKKTLSPILTAAAPTTKISTVPCVRQASRSPSCGAISIIDSDEESRGGMGETAPRSDAELERIEAECEELPLVEEDAEAWEEELDTNVQDPNVEIKSWDELRKQIKSDLKKQSKTLPLSRINQLMILSNFATLRLKGFSRIQASVEIARQWHEGQGNWFARRVRTLAHHYQIFEQLPREKRGGSRTTRSWLHDETVKKKVLDYLTNLPTGKVTPSALQKHINNVIFPELNIKPKKPLTVRTARRWLIKLGWRHTLVKKGVYMDGHERADVVQYRNNEFLPLMAKFEARMVRYEGQEMRRVEPKLLEGEKEIIPQFHDECCFHANDQSSRAW
jgi:hypothetical protein